MPQKLARRDSVFVLAILLLSVLLIVIPSGFDSPYAQSVERPRGQVLAVDDSLLTQYGLVRIGSQTLKVRVLDGPLAGQEVEASNNLMGKMEMDKIFRAGDTVLLVVNTSGGQTVSAAAYDHYRLNVQLILFALFAALLISFAGWTGAKALLSFVFAALLIWKGLLPAFLKGYDPILVSLALVTVLTAVTMCLVAGLTRAALVATLGSFLGVLLTCGLSLLLYPPFRLHGAVMPFAETLIYSGFPHLDLNRMFLSAIFIGASGAVMDLAIDVSASMNEVVQKRPDLSLREAIASGLAVGRAMTSTMVTTLLMAYVAGYMALLMVMLGQGVPPINILNTNYISAEILKTVVGSFGLVTVAPFTAVVGGLIYVKWRKDEHEPRPRLTHPAHVQD